MADLTVGKEGKLIFRFALPMLIGNIFQQLYNVIDSIVVGNYMGKEALSAVGASFPIFFALISLVIGVASGCGVVISQYFGAKKYDKVQIGVDTMFIIIFVSAIIVSIFGIIFTEQIFELIELPATIIPQAIIYLQITFGGLIFAFGYNAIAGILRSLGDSKTPLFFLIISTIANVILDLLFVVYFGWSVASVAYATIIAQAGAFLTGVIYINKKHDFLKINFLKLKWDKEIFFKSLKVGFPTGLQQMIVAVGMTAIFRIVNNFGTNVIAAYSVAMRIDSFAVIPAMNFAQALGTFTGQNIGAKRPERVKRGLKATLFMSSGISVVISFIVFFFGDKIMAVFTPDAEVIRIGYEYLQIVGTSYILFSVMFMFTGVFRGAGDTLIPMFITFIALWIIRIPLSYYLSIDYGEIGIWLGLPAAWLFGMSVTMIYYFTGRWKRIKLVE